MVKVALLIGVSEYEPGLNPLPASVKDIQAIAKVLQNPEMGSFAEADIQKLENPDPQTMHEAIEGLFSDRHKDDLAIVYFSGHGIKDESGKLYLATRLTRKNPQGQLIKSTAVPASFVHNIMSDSRCKRQVVILDCCFSGAFAEGWSAKDDGYVDIQTQLGGEGRAVLTSSTSTQYSFQQQGENLSTYTRYLIEGIETGAADLGNDGVISVDELHEYAKKKVQEAAPAMQPEIYAVKEGFKILLAKAPIGDPKLRYRKEVETYASRGEISVIGRKILDAQYQNLGLLSHEAAAIEAEVLKPYRDYQQKLQEYEQALMYALGRENILSQETQNELQRYQQILGLRDKDIEPIKARIAPQKESVPSPDQISELMGNQTILHSKDETTIEPIKEVIGTSKNENYTPDQVKFPSQLASSISVLRNRAVLAGAGIISVIVITYFFITKPHDPVVTTQSNTSSTSINSPIPTSTPSMSAKDFHERAMDKYDKNDYKGAIEDFNQVLQIDPNNYTVDYYRRGYAHSKLKDYTKAIDDFDKYLQFNPSDIDGYDERGYAYYQLDKYDLAILDYNKSIELNSKQALSYFRRGLAYKAQGKYDLAISDYSKSIELKYEPLNVLYASRGSAYNGLGNYDKAIEDYNQAISIAPEYALAYYNLANSYSKKGNKQAAIENFKKAATLYKKQQNEDDYQDSLNRIKKLQQ
ncbi:caspase, EACC1-associated type [Anabaena lutea]|uniref:Tetratricopeptide repeat protein n=1 Tax=Anabaena lutea FACHB-196 TaxID=2692881 RepID=A0ABR8FK77_9NOST|nr:tetratricopeptide repeat protein [Anabaena lutea]MBD2569993.1 tetratricopeptide repeat protein [Anabaena lutea FACHB-196]